MLEISRDVRSLFWFKRVEMAEAFGGWLVAQASRRDWIGLLADQAARDRGFPRGGSAEDVRARLSAQGADSDAFEQLEDAEAEWLRAR